MFGEDGGDDAKSIDVVDGREPIIADQDADYVDGKLTK